MVKIACVCPPKAGNETRHPNGDEVELRERLDFHAAVTVRQAIRMLYLDDPDASSGEALATFTEQYLIFGIESWTLVDDKGEPLPASRGNIRAFMAGHLDEALVVGDACDEKYTETVLLPLVMKASNSSAPTPTDESTSAPIGSTSTPPTPSSPSSTTTSPTDDTVTISGSRVGASS